jgi:hypothetical protein
MKTTKIKGEKHVCPHCGEEFSEPDYQAPTWVIVFMIATISCLVLAGIGTLVFGIING